MVERHYDFSWRLIVILELVVIWKRTICLTYCYLNLLCYRKGQICDGTTTKWVDCQVLPIKCSSVRSSASTEVRELFGDRVSHIGAVAVVVHHYDWS